MKYIFIYFLVLENRMNKKSLRYKKIFLDLIDACMISFI